MSSAAAAPEPSKRVVPIWAGVKHGQPLKGATVAVQSRKGALLAPRVRTDRAGAATAIARRALPRTFVVVVSRAGKRARAGKRGRAAKRVHTEVLRAEVRDWKRTRVVYVNPYSTIVAAYMKRRPRLAPRRASARVQRHLGLSAATRAPESATFRAQHAFSATRFARAAAKHGGVAAYARRIARDVDGPVRPHRFRPQPQGKPGGGRKNGRGRARALAAATTNDLGATRVQTERELLDAAQMAAAIATGSPSALLQLGKLLDSLLGGGDTSELKQIATQLTGIQTGVDALEQQVSAVDSETSLAAYTTAVDNYASRQATIDLLWEQYVHTAQIGATGDIAGAKAEAQALATNLGGWDNQIQSSYEVPDNAGAPGLMTWAQNSFAKNNNGAILTSATQQLAQAAGSQWWSYWAKDIILHVEKWENPATIGSITAADAASLAQPAYAGLAAAQANGFGTALPDATVYSINSGALYSVGTTWNIKPTVLPPSAGHADWALMTKEQAAALPASSDALDAALVGAVPPVGSNPNSSMSGVLSTTPNNGSAPSFQGTGGGYGVPPQGTSTFALTASTSGPCTGQWQWYENGQGASNTTGAPIIEICPAYDAANQTVVASVCAQVLSPGNFFGWSDEFPVTDWSGIWRRERAIPFKTCNDFDQWQEASASDPSLNWGTGVFVGSAPLSRALNVSNSPSAYYGLWTRPVAPQDVFLVGPVTTTG